MKKRPGGKAQQKRIADAAARKNRRQKVIAFGGLVVLAILMFFQGPKLMKAFGGSDTSTPEAIAATPAVPIPKRDYRALRLVKANGGDPFAARTLTDNDPRAGSVPGPEGTRDPFVPTAGSGPATPTPAPAPTPTAPTPTPALTPLPVVGAPRPGAFAKPGWIVVLASIETRIGRASAESFARTARRKGIGSVSVLDSSTRKPLRAGYYVVYTGPFASLSAVQRSAARVQAIGYRTAYVRQILRY
jgi:SPOR domain